MTYIAKSIWGGVFGVLLGVAGMTPIDLEWWLWFAAMFACIFARDWGMYKSESKK